MLFQGGKGVVLMVKEESQNETIRNAHRKSKCPLDEKFLLDSLVWTSVFLLSLQF